MKLPEKRYKALLRDSIICCVDGIIMDKEGKYLLVKRKNEPMRGEWWVPGGRAYKGEMLEEAFLRKMYEEVGIEVKILMPLGYYEEQYDRGYLGISSHTISVLFSALALSEDIKLDSQSSDYKWSKSLPDKLTNLHRFSL